MICLCTYKGKQSSGKSTVSRRDFPGGPGIENPPSHAGDLGSVPGQGTKTLHATTMI